jgi:type I restriction enzyme R subunit
MASRDLARILVQSNNSIDWTIKESVRSKLKVIVKRLLRQYGYSLDKQLFATENVLNQAELLG